MNYPNVHVIESRSRRAGFLPALQLTVVLAAVVLTVPFATALTSEPARSDGGAVVAAQKNVIDLQKQLRSLQDQLRNLNSREPKNPGANASANDEKSYKLAHDKWQQQVDKLMGMIDALNAQIIVAEGKLKGLQEQAGQGGHPPGSH
jgi:peptidoglycan hydrolase CwlO-like protein